MWMESWLLYFMSLAKLTWSPSGFTYFAIDLIMNIPKNEFISQLHELTESITSDTTRGLNMSVRSCSSYDIKTKDLA